MKITFDKYAYNPLYWHLKKYIEDNDIRYIYVYGGSSAGKTYTITQLLTEKSLIEPANVIVFRKEASTVWKSVFNDFKTIAQKINNSYKFFEIYERSFRTSSKTKIEFSGMDDSEKVKGLSSFKYTYLNELSKFEFEDWLELKRRMRGMVGQTAIFDWNPISETHWIKEKVIDTDEWIDLPLTVGDCVGISQLDENSSVQINAKGNSILIKTTYRDNYWVNGHPIDAYGYLDHNTIEEFNWSKKHTPNDYNIYSQGNWGQVKQGDEFFRNFEKHTHVQPVQFNEHLPINVSVDSNSLPYIAVTLWQVNVDEKKVYQIHEIPASHPNNYASGAGKEVVKYLDSLGYSNIIYTFGDATTRASNTIDPNKKSFYDLFTEEINKKYRTVDYMRRSNPPVALTGEFINALLGEWDGWQIIIGDKNKESIKDYLETKVNKDGGLLKIMVKDKRTKLSYEKNGHILDTARYFISRILDDVLEKYKNRYRPKLPSFHQKREEI